MCEPVNVFKCNSALGMESLLFFDIYHLTCVKLDGPQYIARNLLLIS